MGEAKQKWLAQRHIACPCGSGKAGAECCWTPKSWFKAPAKIDLVATGSTGSHRRCYLRELNTCSDKISGEHTISASVLREITTTKLRVSGMPWLQPGEKKEVGIASMVSNCLCEAHNNALSPLDAVAGRFYRTVQECLMDDNAPPGVRLFSGHDIERWMLKTAAGLAASKVLAANQERLSGIFSEGIDIPALFQDLSAWRTPMGVYVMQKVGDSIQPNGELGIAPLASVKGEIGGLLTQLHGLLVSLLLVRPETIKGSSLEGAPYRPEKFNFNMANGQRVVQLSWVARHS